MSLLQRNCNLHHGRQWVDDINPLGKYGVKDLAVLNDLLHDIIINLLENGTVR